MPQLMKTLRTHSAWGFLFCRYSLIMNLFLCLFSSFAPLWTWDQAWKKPSNICSWVGFWGFTPWCFARSPAPWYCLPVPGLVLFLFLPVWRGFDSRSQVSPCTWLHVTNPLISLLFFWAWDGPERVGLLAFRCLWGQALVPHSFRTSFFSSVYCESFLKNLWSLYLAGCIWPTGECFGLFWELLQETIIRRAGTLLCHSVAAVASPLQPHVLTDFPLWQQLGLRPLEQAADMTNEASGL